MLTDVTVCFPHSPVVWHIAPDQLNLETLQEVFNVSGVTHPGARHELARDLMGDITSGKQRKMVYETPAGPVVISRTVELVSVDGVFQRPTWVDQAGLRPAANWAKRHEWEITCGLAVVASSLAVYILSLTV